MSQNNIAAFFDVDLCQQDISNFSKQIRAIKNLCF